MQRFSWNSDSADGVSGVATERAAPDWIQPPFPADMQILPSSRNPIRLDESTVDLVMRRDVPHVRRNDNSAVPDASIVVATFNNLLFTRMCLESVLANTESSYELLVIDNASSDGTVPYVRALARANPQVRLLVNDRNAGFAAASNRGLQAAVGDRLVLLNNDTIVSRGWLDRLTEHLRDRSIGVAGATTNRIGNEAEVHAPYTDYGGFEAVAQDRAVCNRRRRFDIRTAMMFCLAMCRDAWEQIGPIDEQFGLGMFEDDDYSMRCRAAGLRAVCAEDVFVHHFGQASFGILAAAGQYGELFHANRNRWESKWKCRWHPHERRNGCEYGETVARIRSAAVQWIPRGATVLVVSKGDDALLEIPGCAAWHFPRAQDGGYAGYYPADDQQALSHLREMQQRGAEYLILPGSASWWLVRYPAFQQYLTQPEGCEIHQGDDCAIYRLPAPGTRTE